MLRYHRYLGVWQVLLGPSDTLEIRCVIVRCYEDQFDLGAEPESLPEVPVERIASNDVSPLSGVKCSGSLTAVNAHNNIAALKRYLVIGASTNAPHAEDENT